MSITPDSVISSIRSVPSRVRSPTPENTETPPCCCARLWISSWIRTVLPTPAPPNSPTLPPLMYGAIRSTHLRPVSKISIFGERSRNAGGSRWIGQRSTSAGGGALPSIACPITFHNRPSVGCPDGDGDRLARVDDVCAAGEPVGRVHRDRPYAVVAEVLLHLRDERSVGSSISSALRISGRPSGKTASTTTPLISMIFPTLRPDVLVSDMRLRYA